MAPHGIDDSDTARAALGRDEPADLGARVHFTGWLPTDALAALYARAAVVVIPSRFETFGLAALEAMLHGAPVAATAATSRRWPSTSSASCTTQPWRAACPLPPPTKRARTGCGPNAWRRRWRCTTS